MSEPTENTAIKDAVREAYGNRVLETASCGCGCEPTAASDPRQRLVNTLGYRPEEVASLPDHAAVNSFGCGNPHAFSQVAPGQTVLDIGSGAGIDCLIAADRVGPSGRVIGIDMTEAMLERARANAAEAGADNVEFRLGDAEAMPVDDSSCDWAISNCVINLAPDKPKVFAEIARVLRPGGRVAISDIVFADDVGDLPEVLRRDMGLVAACVGGAVREREYLEAMRGAGLVDVEVIQRQVFDGAQIAAVVDELRDDVGGGERLDSFLADAASRVAGRVWSARIVARRPSGSPRGAGEATPRAAAVEDLSAIAKLLVANELPAHHVDDSLGDFLVVDEDGGVIGCIAVESHGDDALLRSLAVQRSARNRGVGGRLAEAAIALARRRGHRRAVILTSTVREWAQRRGFREIPRAELSKKVRESWEFSERQCDGAACMVLEL